MKPSSVLSNTYAFTYAVTTWLSQHRKIALFAAVLGFLSLGASGAKAQSASSVSCQSSSFSSAGTDACTVNLSSTAQSQTPVFLYSSDPALTVPGTVYVNAGASSASFSVSLASVTSARWVWITAQANTDMGSKTTFGIQLTPSTSTSSSQVQMSSVSCQTSSFNSAGTDVCTVNLSGTAQSQTLVDLYSSSSALTLPATVSVNAGASSAAFSASLAAVSTAQTVYITAQANGSGNKATYGIQLTPAAATSSSQVQMSSVSCQTSSFSSAGTDACTVNLSGAAQSQTPVYLYSSNSALTLPGTVYVNAGASSAAFSASLAAVSSAQTVYITAQANGTGNKATFGIQLTPSTSTQTPALTVNATSVSFGSVALNTPAVQTVTLTSSGTAALTINSATVTGSGFSVSGSSFPVTLNPGQTLNLNVQFEPTVAGSASGQLTITSNSSSNPTATFALTGTGTSGTSHYVDLTWNAPTPTSDPVAGYNVYRAAGGTTSYQLLNSSPVTSTNYTDSAVTAGQSYTYEVMSVDSAGVQSAPSNTSTATIP